MVSGCSRRIATVADGVPGWSRSQVSACNAATAVIAWARLVAGRGSERVARAPPSARLSAGLWSACLVSRPRSCVPRRRANQAVPWAHPVPSSAGTEAPSTTTTQPAVAAMKSSLLVVSGERREARVTCIGSRLLVLVERGDALASDDLAGGRIVLGRDQGRERLQVYLLVEVGELPAGGVDDAGRA